MIEDIEGATSEPTRRGHVLTLSVAAATASLVLLVALFAPAPRVDTRSRAASPAPSPMVGETVFSIASGATRVTLDQLPRLSDTVTLTACAPGIGSSPPVHFVLDSSGRVIAAYSSGSTGRFLPLPPGLDASGWPTVPCDTPDVFAPRINRVR